MEQTGGGGGQGGGGGEGILTWHRRAISAYTWCVTEKGPQRRWLHKFGKEESRGCHCQQRNRKERKDVGVEKGKEKLEGEGREQLADFFLLFGI